MPYNITGTSPGSPKDIIKLTNEPSECISFVFKFTLYNINKLKNLNTQYRALDAASPV